MEINLKDLYFVTGVKDSLKYCDPNDKRLSDRERKKCLKLQSKEPQYYPNDR